MFPGLTPGRHIQASSLREQLQLVFGPQAARLCTLHELTKLTPIATHRGSTRLRHQNDRQHARASATTYTQYVASRHTTTPA
jgi:hypothetical protein